MIDDFSFGVILKKEGSMPARFLLVKQKKHWSFPKGHSEGSEDIETTIRRELFEETGISSISLDLEKKVTEDSYVFERNGEFYKKTNNYFFASTSESVLKIQEGEIYDARFATLDEISDLFVHPTQKSLLEKIKKILNEEK